MSEYFNLDDDRNLEDPENYGEGPECICLDNAGDQPDCPVHSNPSVTITFDDLGPIPF